MTRIALIGEQEQVRRALELLGPKVLAYDLREGWLMVRKTEAAAAIRALNYHGIEAEIRTV